MAEQPYLTIPRAASALGVHANTVRNYIRAGKIRAERVETRHGVTYLIPGGEVERLGGTVSPDRRGWPAGHSPDLVHPSDGTDVGGVLSALLAGPQQEIADLRAQLADAEARIGQMEGRMRQLQSGAGTRRRRGGRPTWLVPVVLLLLGTGLGLAALATLPSGHGAVTRPSNSGGVPLATSSIRSGTSPPTTRSTVNTTSVPGPASAPRGVAASSRRAGQPSRLFTALITAVEAQGTLQRLSLACACDRGLGSVEAAPLLQRIRGKISRLHAAGERRRDTSLWKGARVRLLRVGAAEVTVTTEDVRRLYGGSRLLRVCSGRYRTVLSLVLARGIWKVRHSHGRPASHACVVYPSVHASVSPRRLAATGGAVCTAAPCARRIAVSSGPGTNPQDATRVPMSVPQTMGKKYRARGQYHVGLTVDRMGYNSPTKRSWTELAFGGTGRIGGRTGDGRSAIDDRAGGRGARGAPQHRAQPYQEWKDPG